MEQLKLPWETISEEILKFFMALAVYYRQSECRAFERNRSIPAGPAGNLLDCPRYPSFAQASDLSHPTRRDARGDHAGCCDVYTQRAEPLCGGQSRESRFQCFCD